jgi:hypothetical protein
MQIDFQLFVDPGRNSDIKSGEESERAAATISRGRDCRLMRFMQNSFDAQRQVQDAENLSEPLIDRGGDQSVSVVHRLKSVQLFSNEIMPI